MSPNDVEVELLQLTDDRPHLAIADRASIDIDHGGYLGTRATEEDLIGDVELGAVDGALDHFHIQLLAQQLDHRVPGQSLEDVVRGGRRRDHAVTDQEDVLGAAFADVTILGQHDRLVEPVLHRLGLGQGGVDIDAGDLGAGRCDVIVDAPPARHHAADTAVDFDIVAKGRHVDGERVLEIMEANADLFGAFERKRPDVNVLTEVVAPNQLDAGFAELVQAHWDLELQDLHGVLHAAVMLSQFEEEELLVLGAPVATNPLEDPGPVLQRVGHQTNPGVGVTLDLAVEVDPVLPLFLPPPLGGAGNALCLDRHRPTTSFCLVTRRRELGPVRSQRPWADYMPASGGRNRVLWT